MFKDGKMDAKSAGKLTGMIMKELGGNADGNNVKAVVEGMISAK
jgi:Asp-tRNA(Asn)/Glu-tRNA(Gln) amidotransferase B subunit